MPTQGPNSAASLTTGDNSDGTAWSNPTNAASSNNSPAQSVTDAFENTSYFFASNFGFSIPNAAIDGILVEIEGYSDHGNNNWLVQLTKDGSIYTDSKFTSTGTSEAYGSLGGSSDKWGTTWTSGNVNSTNFGVRLFGANNLGVGQNFYIDHIRVTVYYTEPAGVRKSQMQQYLVR